jgi:hypothetical protein
MLTQGLFTKGFRLEGHQVSCCFDYLSRDFNSRFWLSFMILLGFIVPNIVILFSSIDMYLAMKQRRINTINLSSSQTYSGNLIKNELELAKKVIAQISIFNLSWLPYVGVVMVAQFGDEKKINLWITPLTILIIDFTSKLFVLFINLFYAYSNFLSSRPDKTKINSLLEQQVRLMNVSFIEPSHQSETPYKYLNRSNCDLRR